MAVSAVPPAPPRRRRSNSVVLIVIAAVLAIFVGLPILFCAILAAKAPQISDDSVLTIRINGNIPEGPNNNPFAKLVSASGNAPLSLHDMRELADDLKDDKRVKAVVLQIGPIEEGWGTLEEERDVIGKLRETGKPVYAILDSDFVDEKSYFVATAADHITMNPESSMALNGLEAEVTFWRGTFDKLNIEPEFIMFKEYKSFAEPFQNQHMSPAFHEWLSSVLNEIWGRFVDTVADRRGIKDKAALTALFDKGGFTAKDALAAKLVDELGYVDQVLVEAGQKGGIEADPKSKDATPKTISGGRFLSAHKGGIGHGEKIAVIYAIGPITSAPGTDGIFGGEGISGPDLASTIRQAADDDSIKAILMRVNSPGGSAVGSDFIRREVERAKAKKPFVVSMGGVAGSGGYWIAMDADAIVAQPSTITGSIGVVFGKYNLIGFYNNWLHANVDTLQVGKNADILSLVKPLQGEQKDTIYHLMQNDYDDFVQHVADARKMKFDEAEAVAKGREWTGAQGKEKKLVDELGGFDKALEIVKDKAGLTGKDTQIVVFPKEKSFFEALADLNATSAKAPPADLDGMMKALQSDLGTPKVLLLTPDIEIH